MIPYGIPKKQEKTMRDFLDKYGISLEHHPTLKADHMESLQAKAYRLLLQAKSLQAKKKENWITTEKGHRVLIPEGREKGEYVKEYFEKLNKKNKSEKPFLKDAKSKKQYKKIMDYMKDDIKQFKFQSMDDIFGFDLHLDNTDFLEDYVPETDDDEQINKYGTFYKFYREGNHEKSDKELDKISKKKKTEKFLKAKKIIAQAYNDYMEEATKDKSRKVYRHIHSEEFFDIMESGQFREKDYDDRLYFLSPPFKSWTLDEDHKYAGRLDNFSIETTLDNYDFKVVKASAYPRRQKTIKDGQYVRLYDLEQKEIRVEVGKGLEAKKNMIFHVPKGFLSKLDKAKSELIKKSGFKIVEQER